MPRLHRPDKIGILVLVSTLFALYLGVANLVDFLGFLTMPLGNLGNSAVLSTIAVESAMMSLYIARQRKGAQT